MWLLGALAALLVGVLVLELVGKGGAEHRFEKGLASALRADGGVEVSLEGRPFLLNALSSSFPGVEISLGRSTFQGVDIFGARVELDNVEYSPGGFPSPKVSSVTAESGRGSLSFSAGDLNENLGRAGSNISVSLNGSAIRMAAPRKSPQAAQGFVKGFSLRFRTLSSRDPVAQLALPRFASGLRYGPVVVEGSTLTIDLELMDATLPRPSGGPVR